MDGLLIKEPPAKGGSLNDWKPYLLKIEFYFCLKILLLLNTKIYSQWLKEY
ncbi:MAG: hypothetical protein QM763_01510 [Agriterribacter sp.]